MGEERNRNEDAKHIDIQIDQLDWLLGAAFDALVGLDWTHSEKELSRFFEHRHQMQLRARALPLKAAFDGTLDLSRMPEATRERTQRMIVRAGGLLLGLIEQPGVNAEVADSSNGRSDV
jgi:hypothetical protein